MIKKFGGPVYEKNNRFVTDGHSVRVGIRIVRNAQNHGSLDGEDRQEDGFFGFL